LEHHQFRQTRNQLWVGDYDFSRLVRGSDGPNALLDWRTVDWVTIDHMLKSDVVLSVRDAAGQVRYAMRGYQP